MHDTSSQVHFRIVNPVVALCHDQQLMTYAEAIFPNGCKVAGVHLLPLTIGHGLLLERLRSPFCYWSESLWEQDKQAGDVAMLAWVCSRPWSVAAASIRTDSKRMAWWVKWVGLKRIWMTDVDALDAATYIASSWKGPDVFFPETGNTERSGISPLQGIIRSLTGYIGCSWKEAMDYPVQQSLWDTTAYWEVKGGVRFKTESDLKRIEIAEQMAEELKAANG
jgi:hypothetical protein